MPGPGIQRRIVVPSRAWCRGLSACPLLRRRRSRVPSGRDSDVVPAGAPRGVPMSRSPPPTPGILVGRGTGALMALRSPRGIGAVVRRGIETEEVTGSIPVSPTRNAYPNAACEGGKVPGKTAFWVGSHRPSWAWLDRDTDRVTGRSGRRRVDSRKPRVVGQHALSRCRRRSSPATMLKIDSDQNAHRHRGRAAVALAPIPTPHVLQPNPPVCPRSPISHAWSPRQAVTASSAAGAAGWPAGNHSSRHP
jgi:hypothetical protein